MKLKEIISLVEGSTELVFKRKDKFEDGITSPMLKDLEHISGVEYDSKTHKLYVNKNHKDINTIKGSLEKLGWSLDK